MPWCETCDRFYNPNTLRPDGTCPTCGRLVADPGRLAAEGDGDAAAGEAHTGAPWHFKLLVAATAVYLSYRLFQGIVWVGHHL
ncbi:MAG TPA: hypothetical protein VFV32_12010 [Acidimicrobiales bacterium]|nr:hypothetical protein [Acidimicrobiales bacterium]